MIAYLIRTAARLTRWFFGVTPAKSREYARPQHSGEYVQVAGLRDDEPVADGGTDTVQADPAMSTNADPDPRDESTDDWDPGDPDYPLFSDIEGGRVTIVDTDSHGERWVEVNECVTVPLSGCR